MIYMALAGLAVLLLLLATRWARRRLLIVTVVGGSMRPALYPNDRVLAVRRPLLRQGIVVIAAPPCATDATARPLRVKRLVALPGEILPEPIRLALGLAQGAIVPPGHIAVLGDHPKSEDSKQWGTIPIGSIVGVVHRKLSSGRAEPDEVTEIDLRGHGPVIIR